MNAETPSPNTGIEGSITRSPIHPGPLREGQTDSAPLADATFDVLNDAGAVATFTTDAQGNFRVALPPGVYTIKMRHKGKIGGCGPLTAEVTAAGFAKVKWDCDTGMR